MNVRFLEGFEISDQAIYAFGDLTAVATFKNGEVDDVLVGATYGDFSDTALLKVISRGQSLHQVQGWLSYILPDIASTAKHHSQHVARVLLGDGAETYSGVDGKGQAWLIGFDGQKFAFLERDNEDASPHLVMLKDLRIISDICVISSCIDVTAFVITSPTPAMQAWLHSKMASSPPTGSLGESD